jgi:protein-tyrosine phosphatase
LPTVLREAAGYREHDVMVTTRDLEWPECINARDLGGFPVAGGGATRHGAVIRADHPAHLTSEGWEALWAHGVRTIISLETDASDPRLAAANNRPLVVDERWDGLRHLRLRIENGDDAEFLTLWAETGRWETPLYFADALSRWPARYAALVHHVACSQPGGVLIHCGRGCDRTGLATFVLLALAGASAEDIAADYERSAQRLAPREPEYERRLRKCLAAESVTVEDVFRSLLTEADIAEYLLDAGLSRKDLDTAQGRLVSAG